MTRKNRKKLRYFQLPPNLVRGKFIDLANYVPSSSPRGALSFTQRNFRIWENGVVGGGPGHFGQSYTKYYPRAMCLWLLLPRMKACIDEFQPNTSQANYFEGFWRITSKTNSKIEVTKQFESCVPIADSSKSAAHVVIPSRLAFA